MQENINEELKQTEAENEEIKAEEVEETADVKNAENCNTEETETTVGESEETETEEEQELSENEEKDGKVARISDFYSEIVNNCKKYAEEVLFKKIKNEYAEKGSSGERRGFKKYLYKNKLSILILK